MRIGQLWFSGKLSPSRMQLSSNNFPGCKEFILCFTRVWLTYMEGVPDWVCQMWIVYIVHTLISYFVIGAPWPGLAHALAQH